MKYFDVFIINFNEVHGYKLSLCKTKCILLKCYYFPSVKKKMQISILHENYKVCTVTIKEYSIHVQLIK